MPNGRLPLRPVLRAPIHFATEAGEPVHAPLVLATSGAFHTRLILDTGSDVHLLTDAVARAAGLALGAVEAGTDHAGAAMDSWMVGDVPIRLAEASGAPDLTLRDVVVIPAPAAFASQGIGGILSPQRLHPSAFAVIDEVADELLLLDGEAEAIRTALLERRAKPDVLVLPRKAGYAVPLVEAAIEPHRAVPVLVNTGGRHTEFEPGTVPGLPAGDLMQIGTGVSGAAVLGASAGRQVLALGDARVEVPALMLRSGSNDPPAMIGQDVLRGTVVALGPDSSLPIFWQVPTLESGPRHEWPSPTASRRVSTEAEIRAARIGEVVPLDGTIHLAEYDPKWIALFDREARRVRSALGNRVRMLEHVGSTSVPGLVAKPQIDIVLAVKDSGDEATYVPDLEAVGYTLRIREPAWFEHRVLVRVDIALNLHVFSEGCPEIARMIMFRDHLRSHDADRELYERTKRELAARRWRHMQNYADAKTAAVEEILARAAGSS